MSRHPNHPHVLTPDEVREIRALYADTAGNTYINRKWSLSKLAAYFGVHRGTIHRVVRGETWQDVV